MATPVRVKGLAELNRAFTRADRKIKREWRDTLKEAAEPVRATAERLAAKDIRSPSRGWNQFRIGIRTHVVYVAPKNRGTRNPLMRRPKFAAILMGRAMQPALDTNKEKIVQRVDDMLERMGDDWARR